MAHIPNRGRYLYAGTTTTAEEITLLSKFFLRQQTVTKSYDQGRSKNAIICTFANLGFELQYNLAKDTRTMLEREKNYQLALYAAEHGIQYRWPQGSFNEKLYTKSSVQMYTFKFIWSV